MSDYYNNIEGLLEYLRELSDMFPHKSLTDLIAMAGEMHVDYISNRDLMDSVKKLILQNLK